MRLDVYVNYRGTCEAAFQFYERHLGGRITSLVRHGSGPNPQLPEDYAGKVLRARIELGGTVLMGADIPHAEPRDVVDAAARSRDGLTVARSTHGRA